MDKWLSVQGNIPAGALVTVLVDRDSGTLMLCPYDFTDPPIGMAARDLKQGETVAWRSGGNTDAIIATSITVESEEG